MVYGKAKQKNKSKKVNWETGEATFQHFPKPAVEEPVSATQADTVSINGLEFTSKTSEPTGVEIPPAPPMEKTIDSFEALAKKSGDVPLQNTVASNKVVLNALETSAPKPAAS